MVAGFWFLLLCLLWLWFMVVIVVVARVFYLFNVEVAFGCYVCDSVALFAWLLLLDFTCVGRLFGCCFLCVLL